MAVLLSLQSVMGATLDVLRHENWTELAPQGREATGVLGDYALANDMIVAVVANHELRMGRSSGRSMLQAGGGVLDLTFRDHPNDLLTLFRLGADIGATASDLVKGTAFYDADYAAAFVPQRGAEVTLELAGAPHYSYFCPSEVRYTLRDGEPFLRVEIEFFNTGAAWSNGKGDPFWVKRRRAAIQKSIETQLAAEKKGDVAALILGDDASAAATPAQPPRMAPPSEFICQCPSQPFLRVMGDNVLSGTTVDKRLTWAYDPDFGQAYGVWSGDSAQENRKLSPDATYKIWCMLIPGRDLFEVRRVANTLAGTAQHELRVMVADSTGVRANALVRLESGRQLYGAGRSATNGMVVLHAPDGLYRVVVAVDGQKEQNKEVRLPDDTFCKFDFVADAQVNGTINGEDGQPLPCKVAFQGRGETRDPSLAAKGGSRLAGNLVYTPDGRFSVQVPPGRYRVVVTRGPEYDAVTMDVDLPPGAEESLRAVLRRTVVTTGWVSLDVNTLSARSALTPDYGKPVNTAEGRLLNLVAEQIDFAPTMESNTVTDDQPMVERLGLQRWIKTTPGIRLTDDGRKYAFNTQLAFPIEFRPYEQDGGVPQRPQHCSQIDWLRSWGVPFPADDPWHAVRNAGKGYDKVIIISQPDNKLAPEHIKNYDLYSSMWRDADIAVDWRDNRAHIKPFLRDSDGDGIPDRISHHSTAATHAWDVRTLEPLIDPQKRVENDILDWLETVRHGWRMPAIIGSTARSNFHGVGRFRSYVRCAAAEPAQIDVKEIMQAIKQGAIIMTTGPFVDLRATTDTVQVEAFPGDTIATANGAVRLTLAVQAPDWITVDEVEILCNGVTDPSLKINREASPDRFKEGAAQFNGRFDLTLTQDTHFIAIARGHGPNLRHRETARDETVGHAAITNPLYVDLGGNGFLPQSPLDDAVESSMRLARPLLSREGSAPACVEVSFTNHGALACTEILNLKFVPEGVLEIVGKPDLHYTLAPFAATKVTVEVALTAKAQLEALLATGGGKKTSAMVWLQRSGIPPGVAPSRLRITADSGAEAERKIEHATLQDMLR